MRRKARGQGRSVNDSSTPKYSISVASDLSGVPQQQLRRMEESGLLTPTRTSGNTRRYSDDDVSQIAEVSDLVEQGVNAAGIHQILALRAELAAALAENESLCQRLAAQDADETSSQPDTH
jgi:MerR family transcriptional regulator, heat shock protein HspR